MLSSTKETLRRPRTSSRGRVLLTCPLSERYYRTFTTYDVEVPENIIVFLRPDTATGLASPVQHDSRARLPSPTLSPLGNAVRITCPPVSVNGRPRAHLNPSEPLHSMQSLPLGCCAVCKPHSTRELRLLWTTALLYTTHSSSSSTQIISPCFSFPSLLFLTPTNIASESLHRLCPHHP